MPMTMQQIMARTPSNRKQKAEYVRILEVKVKNTSYKTRIYKAKLNSTHNVVNDQAVRKRVTPTSYVATVETNDKMVVVSCSCEDFMYTWEMALVKRRAARIEYSNGESPDERNPRMIPGCCAHLFKFGELLIKKGKVA
jgi:hypothetical protein